MEKRTYSLSPKLESILLNQLKHMQIDVNSSHKIAKSVLALSDGYTHKSGIENIWANPNNQAAYLCYFLVLNSLRLQSLIKEAQTRGFFEGLDTVIDFGSGCGALDLSLREHTQTQQFKYFYFIETSKDAVELHKSLLDLSDYAEIEQWITEKKASSINTAESTMVSFSYSLNEVKELPTWALQKEALFIIEPSTSVDSRNLLRIRQQLIEKGFHIWAPCLHQMVCPLLKHSKKDWCHDRIFTALPAWFQNIEKHLPIKNRTVTYSYLLARKTPSTETFNLKTRTIGDTQKEKGKVKQMVCHNEERLFLSWLTKNGGAPQIPRGAITDLEPDLEKKGNELRPF